MSGLTITIGWTLTDKEDRSYSSFSDGYKPGVPQHEEAFIIDGFDETDPSEVAESAFHALNHPDPESFHPDTLASLIYQAVKEAGYNGSVRGRGYPVNLCGHYSLSVGDTVTVDGTMLACEPAGWRVVEPAEGPFTASGVISDGVTRLERHDDNGKVFISWFDQDSTTGFIWSGKPTDPVQVQREMGEPIIATFPVQDYVQFMPKGTMYRLAAFKQACQAWLSMEVQ